MALNATTATVSDAMSAITAIVGPEHTLHQAAERMVANATGAAVVIDPSLPGPCVVTERDLLFCVAAGQDPNVERVADHMSTRLVTAWPNWPITKAGALMIRHGIRHVLVFDGVALVGILSMRDVMRFAGSSPLLAWPSRSGDATPRAPRSEPLRAGFRAVGVESHG